MPFDIQKDIRMVSVYAKIEHEIWSDEHYTEDPIGPVDMDKVRRYVKWSLSRKRRIGEIFPSISFFRFKEGLTPCEKIRIGIILHQHTFIWDDRRFVDTRLLKALTVLRSGE